MSDRFIPLSVPNLKGNELKYVTDAIETEWVSTAGSYVDKFEERMVEYTKSKYAVSCQSGTAGIHTALLCTGVTSGDLVIAPALTFIAAVNPIKYVGANPIFMDCDDSLCIDPEKLKEFCENECELIENKLIHIQSKQVVKAIVVVHVFGNMADMEAIMKISKKYKLSVIEDATEALGTYFNEGYYEGEYAGTIGDIGVYSFNGNKIITTGGGGMIVSNSETYIKKARHLTTQAKSDELYYTHDEIGYNYRMTNVQAAIGLAQLEQLEDFISVKNTNYDLYKDEIMKINGLSLLEFRSDTRSNKWFYGVNCEDFAVNRDQMIKQCSKFKIQTRPIWGLICNQTPYLNERQYKVEKARYYWKNIVNIPCSTNLEKEDVLQVVHVLARIEADNGE